MNPRKLLDRITFSIIAIFTLVMLLSAFLFIRHLRLQQVVDNSGMEILANIEDLQATSDELQASVESLRDHDEPPTAHELEQIDRQLDEINQHLENIEENIDDIVPLVSDADSASSEELAVVQDEINRTFLFMAWIVGITSLGTAIVAYVVLKPRRLRSKRRLSMAGEARQPDQVDKLQR